MFAKFYDDSVKFQSLYPLHLVTVFELDREYSGGEVQPPVKRGLIFNYRDRDRYCHFANLRSFSFQRHATTPDQTSFSPLT